VSARNSLIMALCVAVVAASATANAAAKPESRELNVFLGRLRHARAAGIATVTNATVAKIVNVRRTERGKSAWAEDVAFRWDTILYGPQVTQKTGTVRLAATPPRGANKPNPRFRKGDKLVVLQIDYPRWKLSAAVRWSKAAEEAALAALAPGWAQHGGRTFLCPWCTGREFTEEVGKCRRCGAQTASGMKKLCPKCARTLGRCAACSRKLGPATLGVDLGLSTIPPTAKVKDPRRIAVAPGTAPELWVWVDSRAQAAPEFQCWENKLDTCNTLCFLVEGPGIQGRTVAFFERRILWMYKSIPPRPLKGSASGLLKLRPKELFRRHGSYTVRAVAGRLVSEPVTVVVKPLGAVAEPQPGAGPVDAEWQAGNNFIKRVRNGKVMWMMRLKFPVGQVRQQGDRWIVTSNDGATEVHIDAATGKMLRIKKLR